MEDIALDGILVEQMVKGGLEMIVGARRDPGWGPVVMEAVPTEGGSRRCGCEFMGGTCQKVYKW